MDKKMIRNIKIFSGIMVLGGAIVIANYNLIVKDNDNNEKESTTSTVQTIFTEPVSVETTISMVETTTTPASVIEQRDPEEFYKNYEPLKIQVFEGNNVICEESVYKKQIEAIDEEIDFLYGKEYDPSLESKLLINALMSNENLRYEDKMILFPMIEYFNDNPYIDREELYNKILTLKIENEERDYLGAEFLKNENKIIIYTSYYEALPHEFFHFSMSDKSNSVGGFLNEGMTMLLNNEYFSETTNTDEMKDNRVLYVKMLIETIGSEKVLEAYTKNDWSIIQTELLKINSDNNMAYRLYYLMDVYCDIYESINCNDNLIDAEAESVKNELSEIMTDYYNIKYPDNNDAYSFFSIYEKKFMLRPNSNFARTSKRHFNSRYFGEENEAIYLGGRPYTYK